VVKQLIKGLVRSLQSAHWSGILSALLVASLLLSLTAVMLYGAQGAHWELATEGASWGEVPAKVVWTLIKAVGVHWDSGSGPVASVNWNGRY
jgi:hypothetical protein